MWRRAAVLARRAGAPFPRTPLVSLQHARPLPHRHHTMMCDTVPTSDEAQTHKALKKARTESVPKLQIMKLSEHATIPTRKTAGAAGYDLYSAQDVVVPAEGKAVVKTDIAMAIPPTCYGRVAPRSGLAAKHHLDVGAGVIDSDYRGNVGVIMFNFAKTDYSVTKGDRVAQLILERIMTPEVEEVEALTDTERGEGGFGSTGTN